MDNFTVIQRAESPDSSYCDESIANFAKYNRLNEVIYDHDVARVRDYCTEEDVSYAEFKALQRDYSEFRCDPPLCVAAMRDSVETIRYLVELGFDPCDYGTADMETRCSPLQFAAANGAVSAARELALRCKVDVNCPRDSPCSPLMLSIDAHHLEVARVLVAAGAHISPGRGENTSPLHSAASFNYGDICEFLLSAGADVNSRNTSGYTPLHSACNGAACYRSADTSLWRPRHCVEAARVLVDAGADVNAVSLRSKASPLFIAVSENSLELVTLLCSRGADPQIRNKSGNSPLHIAATDARYDVARHLVVEVNADLDSRTFHSQSTPFKFALCNKSEKAVRLLLGAGHYPDANCRRSLSNIVEQFRDGDWQEDEEEESGWHRCTEYAQRVVSNPRTLQNLCCFSVRKILGRHVSTKVSGIELPHTVKDIITLSHL